MAFADLELADSRCRTIREFIIVNPGGRENRLALERLQDAFRALSEGVEDDECRRLVREMEACSLDLFSAAGHKKWDRGQTSVADVLRLQILRLLNLFGNRLSAIAAARAAGDEPGAVSRAP